ncbi:hypothetical protein B0H13DRAFT_2313278 [Mycena leptocephala]|nr:hypothetical protein B0H13DRAFT_2313278 [Mycena leptocephala]
MKVGQERRSPRASRAFESERKGMRRLARAQQPVGGDTARIPVQRAVLDSPEPRPRTLLPGVASSSTICGCVRRASAGPRLGICSPTSAFPVRLTSTYDSQRQMLILGTRVRIRATAQDPTRRIIVCVRHHPACPRMHRIASRIWWLPACCLVSWHAMHDGSCAPLSHPRVRDGGGHTARSAPVPLRISARLPPYPRLLRSPGSGSCIPQMRRRAGIPRDACLHESEVCAMCDTRRDADVLCCMRLAHTFFYVYPSLCTTVVYGPSLYLYPCDSSFPPDSNSVSLLFSIYPHLTCRYHALPREYYIVHVTMEERGKNVPPAFTKKKPTVSYTYRAILIGAVHDHQVLYDDNPLMSEWGVLVP